ncbi:thiamine phosphate synthase [Macrococcus brunensis]|uniref:thiamine phosphate synthase n=2 Tax=Macrococcus brunensis TaxID=198483 RepID=UPI001EEF800B|nr:thiamine phosphate synthase [Macrococcus brunensis]ULG74292.1 thiamine phosphate synthase [Macrococcus brunensis]
MMLKIAITPERPPQRLIKHLLTIEPFIDGVILRLSDSDDAYIVIQSLLQAGFDKKKLIVHSDVTLLNFFQLSRIHFRQGDRTAYNLKEKRPQLSVSMAVHSVSACQEALWHHLDYGLYSHLFPTPSKPAQVPRTPLEIKEALATGLPLIALGGITAETLPQLPAEFVGYAGIRLFEC